MIENIPNKSFTSNHNQQIYGWLEKIENNINKFKKDQNESNMTDEDRLFFITHQYHLVMLIHKALNGKVIFVGARPIN
jgi:hypothetical protein